MKFTLDLSKWRCGGEATPIGADYDKYSIGKGQTALLNKEGYMCCLGQFSLQICPGIEKDILDTGEPGELPIKIDGFNRILNHFYYGNEYMNEPIVSDAICINDNAITTIREKLDSLKELFAIHGHEIEIYNPTNIPY